MDIDIDLLLVSKRILEDRQKPMWMYREQTARVRDSGWRIFSSDEDENYLNNPKNFMLITGEQMIAIDDTLKGNLFAPVGSSFERNKESGKWEIVDMG